MPADQTSVLQVRAILTRRLPLICLSLQILPNNCQTLAPARQQGRGWARAAEVASARLASSRYWQDFLSEFDPIDYLFISTTRTHALTHTHTYVHSIDYLCMYVCMYLFIYIDHLSIYLYVYIYTFVYMYIYVYIYRLSIYLEDIYICI